MNVGEAEQLFRSQVDDQAHPGLWSSEEFLDYFNEAELEACRRARLLVDSRSKTNPNNVCRLTLATGTSFYALDRRVIYVRRAALVGRTLPLAPMDYRDMDQCAPGWESHSGEITGYVRGMDSGQFRPYRIPEAANNGGFIDLIVVREPLAAMDSPEDSPEIPARYHRSLLDWVKYRAYGKRDAETYEPNLAQKFLVEFEREFGTRERASAMEEEWQRITLPFNEQDGTY